MIKRVGRELRDLLVWAGAWPALDAPDRRVLDGVIFPYLLGRSDLHRVLFVGCHWYTWHYNKVFRDKDYMTLEIDPARRRYGARRHIIASVVDVADHVEPASLDVVLLLGVIGWGLDDEREADAALRGVRKCLRQGGVLIIGWDDVPEHRPFEVGGLSAMGLYERWEFPPLAASRYRCEADPLLHTFEFLLKPANTGDGSR